MHSNTPPQTDTSPISWVCLWYFGCRSALVRTSAICSGSWQLLIKTFSSWTNSCSQCQRIAICLDCLWNCGFFAITIDPLLSPRISVGTSSWSKPSLPYRLFSQQASRAASVRAMYFASVDDKAMETCFLKLYVMALFPARNI